MPNILSVLKKHCPGFAKVVALSLALTLATNSHASGDKSRVRWSRRNVMGCALALGSYVAVGKLDNHLGSARAQWDKAHKKLVVDGETQNILVQLLSTYLDAAPGIAVNTLIAALADRVTAMVKSTEDLDKTSPTSFDSVLKTHMLLIGELTYKVLFPAQIGNVGLDEDTIKKMLRNPQTLNAEMVVIAPLMEEIVFRLIPGSVIGANWKVGFVSSTAFAFAHNLTDHGFDLSILPVPQFLGGMLFWYLMRERGFDHNLLAHMANNNVAAMMMLLNPNSL